MSRALFRLLPRVNPVQLRLGACMQSSRSYFSSPILFDKLAMDKLMQPEDCPADDTDFDEDKYCQLMSYDKPVPDHIKKPESFYTDDVPNIDRLRQGMEEYEIAMGLLERDQVDAAITSLTSGISKLEQHVFYKYENAEHKVLRNKLAEYLLDPYCNLAFCYQKTNKYKHAKVFYIKAIKLLKEEFDRGEQLAQVAMNLAEVYGILNRPDIATKVIKMHIPFAKTFFEPVHYAGALANLSVSLADQSLNKEAIGASIEAIKIFKVSAGLSHPVTLRYLSVLFRLLVLEGDRKLYDAIHAEFSECTKVPTFEETEQNMSGEKQNKGEENMAKERREIEEFAENFMPAMEKAEATRMKQTGMGAFSSGLLGESFVPS